ncbi:MAG: DUF2878 family protein [Deltaproteobacteria bacterium]|nr:DUF2878 family protein [Deltaproteobacteria bacterium]MBW2532626.1 DUF2878 family protein [Deltaproteobacteria bacterium]
MPPIDDRAFAVDAVAVAAVGALVCAASQNLLLMTALVPVVVVARCAVWWRLPLASRGHGPGVEATLFGVCLALGAFNDWNSVVHHRIYEYTVPCYLPAVTTIPLWMLLYWGLIVRAFVSLCRWGRLAPPAAPRDEVAGCRSPRPWLKVGIELVLVLGTRQAIYRWSTDPIWSWLPFAIALVAWLSLLRPRRHDLKLLAIVALVGPAVESLYIQVGQLHRYSLGWLGGVPLWIALWWMLAIVIVSDLSLRALGWLSQASRDTAVAAQR